MKVEIWSDVVCPWCYIGKRRLETALAGFAHREQIEVVWRSFELDPNAPRVQEGDPATRLASKYGMSRQQAIAAQDHLTSVARDDGLEFHLATAQSGNSFDAHRLVHLAAEYGLGDQMKERLFSAYLVEGQAIGDLDTLICLAGEVGIDETRANDVLRGDEYAAQVRADEAEARDFGISGVPFFVIDRTYGISGAQPAETLADALAKAWESTEPLARVATGSEAGACDRDQCAR